MREIKILGTGCAKCKQLEKTVREAVDEMGLDASVEKVTELTDIMSYGIMSTPGLVVDGEVRLSGRLPKVSEVKSILERAGA
ncbi:MAG: TM0996/MTH895 family glutaredoxin-like protein [Coriobacteriia bacterium]|nr:TM0996/MTH895 family glutaredoxin-like protein [Coriobacteriia bacterium]